MKWKYEYNKRVSKKKLESKKLIPKMNFLLLFSLFL